MLSFRASGGKTQQLEIAVLSADLLQNSVKKLLAKRRFKNALESDFVKHSPNFGGSGVDLGRHFEGAFEAKNARDSILEASF